MRTQLLIVCCGLLLMPSLTHAAEPRFDWPPVDKLPAQTTLPDPLVSFGGTPIRTAEVWSNTRRPELISLFQNYMYGELPTAPNATEAVELFHDPAALGGTADLREVELRFTVYGQANPVPIRLLIALPAKAKGPVPIFVGPNFGGNHLYCADERIRIPTVWMYPKYPGVKNNLATAAGRGMELGVWPIETILARGFGVATFYAGDVQPDRPDVAEGLRAILPKAAGNPTGHDPATIVSWAWGVHRCVDYLTKMPGVDAKRIAAVGHSRLGKTVLLAAALDTRIALAIPNQAGCGGTGPSRHTNAKAESVERITKAFPHWFCGNFRQFVGSLEKLPFDQHCLVAACAPRPVLFTNAQNDEWANPRGQFAMLAAATPVYELLGVEGLSAKEFPPLNTLVNSRLGYFIRPGDHAMTPADWQIYLEFAEKWLK